MVCSACCWVRVCIFNNRWKQYSQTTGRFGADSNHPVKAFVYDNPSQLFLVASNASLTNESTARGHVFANANFATATSGSTTTGLSSATLAVSTIAATNTLQMRIVGIQDDVENQDFAAAGIGLIVRLNNSFNAPNGAIAAGTVATTGV